MKASCEMTLEEKEHYMKTLAALNSSLVGLERDEILLHFKKTNNSGGYSFSGQFSAEAEVELGRMPTPDEIILLIDNSVSHFGAACTLKPDGFFKGYVYR